MSERNISIIIPTFNEEDRLNRLLPFLQKNSGNSILEIIIADGGSSDHTVPVAEKHGAKTIRCKRKGRAAQMNEAAREAAGPVLYFLHADTFPPKNFDHYINRAIRNGYPSGCFRLSFDDSHPALRMYGWFTRFSLTLFRFGDQSLYVQREHFNRIGCYDESLTVMEDQQIVGELKKESSFKVLEASVTTSARRYKLNGKIRLQFVFLIIVLMYYMGAEQDTLVHVYQSLIRTDNDIEN